MSLLIRFFVGASSSYLTIDQFNKDENTCMNWKNWLKTAYKLKVAIVDWPNSITPIPGDRYFEYKHLNQEQLKLCLEGVKPQQEEDDDESA